MIRWHDPRFWLRWLVFIAVLVLLLVLVDFRSALKIAISVNLFTLFFYFSIDIVFNAVESYRVRYLAGKEYPYGAVFRSKFLSQFLGLFFPGLTGTELVRALLLDPWRPRNKYFLILVMISSRLYGLLGIAAIAFAGILWDSSQVPRVFLPYRSVLLLGCFLMVVFPLLFNLRVLRRVAYGFLKRLPRKLQRFGKVSYLATTLHCRFNYWLVGTLTSVITSYLLVLQYGILGDGLGIHLSLVSWAIWAPVLAVGSYLPIGFGGFGSQDATLAFMAAQEGLALEPFMAMSLIIHAQRVVLSLIGLLFVKDAGPMVKELSGSKFMSWVLRRSKDVSA